MLGDYPAGHRLLTRSVAMSDFARVCGGLEARLGTVAILGNHDWWADPRAQLAGRGPVQVHRLLERHGIQVLHNDAVRIRDGVRSEEHTSELQSLMRISYAVFCLNKKKTTDRNCYRIQSRKSHTHQAYLLTQTRTLHRSANDTA